MYIVVLCFVLAHLGTDEPLNGDNADGDTNAGDHDTEAEMSTRGASAVGTAETNAEAKVPSSAVPAMEVPTTDTAKVSDGAEIPHRPEV
jgi:hypothetical protein